MALIFADDFQQLSAMASMTDPATGGSVSVTTGVQILDTFEAYGFERNVLQYNSASVAYPTVCYATQAGAVRLQYLSSTAVFSSGTAGLGKTIKYTGDTLYLSFWMTLQSKVSGFRGVGTLISLGNNLYTVSVLDNGNFALNGIDTDTPAYYAGVDVKTFYEVILGPDYIEFWISNTRIARQPRTPLPIDYFRVGFSDYLYNWALYLHSLVICDNTGTTLNSRIGRRPAKTFLPLAATTVESTLSNTGSNALAILKPTAISKSIEAGASIGSLISPDGFVKNAFTTKIDVVPVALLVNVQMKRRMPAGDGLTAVPYVKIGANVTEGVRKLPSSLWNVFSCEVPAIIGSGFTDVEFGYVHDYVDMHKVYIDSRTGVAVYGEESSSALKGSPYLANAVNFTSRTVENLTFSMYQMPFSDPKFTSANVDNVEYSAYFPDYTKTALKTVMQTVNNTTFTQDQTP